MDAFSSNLRWSPFADGAGVLKSLNKSKTTAPAVGTTKSEASSRQTKRIHKIDHDQNPPFHPHYKSSRSDDDEQDDHEDDDGHDHGCIDALDSNSQMTTPSYAQNNTISSHTLDKIQTSHILQDSEINDRTQRFNLSIDIDVDKITHQDNHFDHKNTINYQDKISLEPKPSADTRASVTETATKTASTTAKSNTSTTITESSAQHNIPRLRILCLTDCRKNVFKIAQLSEWVAAHGLEHSIDLVLVVGITENINPKIFGGMRWLKSQHDSKKKRPRNKNSINQGQVLTTMDPRNNNITTDKHNNNKFIPFAMKSSFNKRSLINSRENSKSASQMVIDPNSKEPMPFFPIPDYQQPNVSPHPQYSYPAATEAASSTTTFQDNQLHHTNNNCPERFLDRTEPTDTMIDDSSDETDEEEQLRFLSWLRQKELKSMESLFEMEAEVSSTISALENICPRVVFVPGPNDVQSLFRWRDYKSTTGVYDPNLNPKSASADIISQEAYAGCALNGGFLENHWFHDFPYDITAKDITIRTSERPPYPWSTPNDPSSMLDLTDSNNTHKRRTFSTHSGNNPLQPQRFGNTNINNNNNNNNESNNENNSFVPFQLARSSYASRRTKPFSRDTATKEVFPNSSHFSVLSYNLCGRILRIAENLCIVDGSCALEIMKQVCNDGRRALVGMWTPWGTPLSRKIIHPKDPALLAKVRLMGNNVKRIEKNKSTASGSLLPLTSSTKKNVGTASTYDETTSDALNRLDISDKLKKSAGSQNEKSELRGHKDSSSYEFPSAEPRKRTTKMDSMLIQRKSHNRTGMKSWERLQEVPDVGSGSNETIKETRLADSGDNNSYNGMTVVDSFIVLTSFSHDRNFAARRNRWTASTYHAATPLWIDPFLRPGQGCSDFAPRISPSQNDIYDPHEYAALGDSPHYEYGEFENPEVVYVDDSVRFSEDRRSAEIVPRSFEHGSFYIIEMSMDITGDGPRWKVDDVVHYSL